MENWEDNIIDDTEGLKRLLRESRRIAVLGMRSEQFPYLPAHFVAAYLDEVGFEVIPVPVYEPELTTMLGKPVYRSLLDIPGEIDMVDVFRRADQLPMHVSDLLAVKPKSVWLQLGIFDDEFAETLARAGIKVVQDRCLMVDHRRLKSDS